MADPSLDQQIYDKILSAVIIKHALHNQGIKSAIFESFENPVNGPILRLTANLYNFSHLKALSDAISPT